MTRKFLEDMGLTKEQIDSILDQNSQDIGGLKRKITDLETQAGTDKTTIGDYETKLKDYDPDWKTKLSEAETNAQAKINDFKFETALNECLKTSKTKDGVAVKAHLDREKLKIGDDGKIAGLDEQLKTIKETSPFLFDDDTAPTVKYGSQTGTQNNLQPPKDLAGALQEHYTQKN